MVIGLLLISLHLLAALAHEQTLVVLHEGLYSHRCPVSCLGCREHNHLLLSLKKRSLMS